MAANYCRRYRRQTGRASGFTLIELMVALAVFGIMLAVGIPSLKVFLERSELTTETNRFVGALSAARVEAVKRNLAVVLCPSKGLATCDGSNWSDGWIVFADVNGDGLLATDNTEEVFSFAQSASAALTIKGDTNLASTIIYKADGTLKSDAGSVIVCHTKLTISSKARKISLTTGGRSRIDEATSC